MDKIQLGKLGEKIAENFLVQKGYQVLEKNFRRKGGEIDILALENNTLVAVEVKTRLETDPFKPSEAINSRKIRTLQENIIFYKSTHSGLPEKLRIDFIGIILNTNFSKAKIQLIQNISF